MIIHNIALSILFLVVAALCFVLSMIGFAGGPQGGSDNVAAWKFFACAIVALLGIVLPWVWRDYSGFFWLLLVADIIAAIRIYFVAIK